MVTRKAGYLPDDRLGYIELVLFGFQHIVAMFPATVLVALLCGFHVGTVLLASGLSTLVALTLSKNAIGTFIPLYYGSSFSYIASYLGIAQAMNHDIVFGVPAPDEIISLMQAGIVVTGVFNIVVGAAMRSIGKRRIDRILPPIVTGPVACVIGFALSKAALDMCFTDGQWGIAVATFFTTIACSHLLQGRGTLGMVPVLLGAIAGYLLTLIIAPDHIVFKEVIDAPLFAIPHMTWPDFSGPLLLTAVFSISVMALATIPESTAHLYQISIYVDQLSEVRNQPRANLAQHVGFNLICDGVGDVICGICGGPAGTNYGENNSLMAITKNYSGRSLITAAVISILLAFVGKLAAFVGTIPTFVTGGLALYLFGVIGMQGIALMHQGKVNFFDSLHLGIGGTIMVIGIGGHIGFEGGFLPIVIPGAFPSGLPAIATAAVVGILLNLALGFWNIPTSPVGPTQAPIVGLKNRQELDGSK